MDDSEARKPLLGNWVVDELSYISVAFSALNSGQIEIRGQPEYQFFFWGGGTHTIGIAFFRNMASLSKSQRYSVAAMQKMFAH